MATIPVGEIVLWRVVTAAGAGGAGAGAALADPGVNLATPATWTGTANHEFYQVDSMHIGVVAEVQNAGGVGETCHVIFGLCAGNTVAERATAAGLILAAAGGAGANRAIVTNIPVAQLTKEIVINKRVFGGSRRRRQSKKRRNQRNHNNNQ